MSAGDFSDPNPYSAPEPAHGHEHAEGDFGSVPIRPTWVTVVCIFSIVMGSFGLLGSCTGGIGLGFQAAMSGSIGTPPAGQGLDDVQMKIMKSQQAFFPIQLCLVIFNLPVGGLLVAGGIGGLMNKAWAPSALWYGLIAAITYVLVSTIATGFIQYQMQSTMAEMMNDLQESPGGPDFGNMMRMFSVVGIVMAAVFGLIKIVLYGVSLSIVRSDNAKAWFATRDS